MNVYFLIYLLFLHWAGDFVAQGRFIADNKSKNVWVLLLHVIIYSVVIGLGTIFIIPKTTPYKDPWAIWLGINFILHLLIDGVTSRYTKKLYQAQNYYGFFSLVGFDQFLHSACLILTTKIFLY